METQLNLTRREYFAAMAMQGLLANSYKSDNVEPLSELSIDELAEISVYAADALINELKENE